MLKINSNYFRVLVLLILVFSLSSCTIAKISGRGPVPLVLNNLPAKVEVISHFKESKIVAFDYTGSFDVSEVIAKKLADSKADAAINVVVKVKTDPVTFLVNFITIGLAQAKRFEVEGDLVKIVGGLSSIIQNSNLSKMQNLKDVRICSKISHRNRVQFPFIARYQNGYIVIPYNDKGIQK